MADLTRLTEDEHIVMLAFGQADVEMWGIGADAAGRAIQLDYARAILAALAKAGRLLPPGTQVAYRIVWTGQADVYVDGDVEDLDDGRDHLAIIRGLAFVKEARLERRYVGPWEVVPDDSEKGAGDG